MRSQTERTGILLQRIVLFVIFLKIQGFGANRDSFGWVIAKPEATIAVRPDALFAAQNQSFLQLGSMGTIAAGALDFFAK